MAAASYQEMLAAYKQANAVRSWLREEMADDHAAAAGIKEAVYRIDPKTGKMDKVLDDVFKPNVSPSAPN